jgi:hypothetical protein
LLRLIFANEAKRDKFLDGVENARLIRAAYVADNISIVVALINCESVEDWKEVLLRHHVVCLQMLVNVIEAFYEIFECHFCLEGQFAVFVLEVDREGVFVVISQCEPEPAAHRFKFLN